MEVIRVDASHKKQAASVYTRAFFDQKNVAFYSKSGFDLVRSRKSGRL
jgi:hypothetical protein